MNPWFADTFFFLALLSDKDRAHGRAVEARASGRPIVTTEFVLLELGDHLCDRLNRRLFVELCSALHADPSVKVLPIRGDLFRRGYDLYANRPDKDWSLTDCISFVVMADRGISDALTGDHHFEQAGFRALLK